MKLKEYIEELNRLLDEVGDVDLYTSIDDEGNGYNQICFSPEVRYLSPHEDKRHPDYLIPEREEDQILRYWLDENGIEEEDYKKLKRVVLL